MTCLLNINSGPRCCGRALTADRRVVFTLQGTRRGDFLEKYFRADKSESNNFCVGFIAAVFNLFLLVGCSSWHTDVNKNIKNSKFPRDSKLQVNITTQMGKNGLFIKGDGVQFLVNLNRSAYVVLILKDANAQMTKLYPVDTDSSEARKFPAASYVSFPSENSYYRVTPPFGSESAWAIASSEPVPDNVFPTSTNRTTITLSAIELFARLQSFKAQCRCQIGLNFVQFETTRDHFSWPIE